MIKFGIIGTNWITQQFVEAAQASNEYELTAVYSRHQDTATAFSEKNGGSQTFTALDDFFLQPVIFRRFTLRRLIVCIMNKRCLQ